MTTIGGYRVITSLGRGGMADVFLAVRRGDGGFTKLVVVKRLRDDLWESMDGAQYRQLMLDEANLAARLHHPNIVQTFEVGVADGAPFLAMEYLDGQPLTQVLMTAHRAGRRIPERLALHVVAQVLAGLEHAHDLRDYDGIPLAVVHRDVSPHNVFWTYDGDIKIVDFGVARFTLSQAQTAAGVVKGKVAYMAPEQARGETIDHRVDLFAAGIILWELLSGRRLLRADSEAASMHKLLYEPLPELAAVRPDLDPRVVALVARALERDPARRYPAAALMRADLERVIGTQPPRREDLAAFIAPWFIAERKARAAHIARVRLEPEAPVAALGSSPAHRVPAAEPTGPTRGLAALPPPRSRRWRAPAFVALVAMAAGGGAALSVDRGGGGAVERLPAAPAPAAGPSPVVIEAAPSLRLCGSNTIGAELAPALAEAFVRRRGATDVVQEHQPHGRRIVATTGAGRIVIDLRAEGTATAFTGLAAGTCDVGLASRPASDDEVARFAAAGLGDLRRPSSEHVIALDGIAVIVHPDNPVATLDRAALHAAFTGEVTDWRQLGGEPGPIAVLARDDRSGTFDTFKHLVLGKTPLVAGARRYADSTALAAAVAAEPRAIGFVGLAYLGGARAVAVSDQGAAPTLPTAFTVGTEAYLLSRRLYAYTTTRPATPLAAEWVTFAMSNAGQHVVKTAGFVDLAVSLVEASACDERCPRAYAAHARKARRLSLDLRFRRGADELDSRAVRDLDRVVGFLRDLPEAQVLLFGFSDTQGAGDANRRLSQARAQAVADQLIMRGVRPEAVVGFGAARPVADNRDEGGRERNRRVEIWLRR